MSSTDIWTENQYACRGHPLHMCHRFGSSFSDVQKNCPVEYCCSDCIFRFILPSYLMINTRLLWRITNFSKFTLQHHFVNLSTPSLESLNKTFVLVFGIPDILHVRYIYHLTTNGFREGKTEKKTRKKVGDTPTPYSPKECFKYDR